MKRNRVLKLISKIFKKSKFCFERNSIKSSNQNHHAMKPVVVIKYYKQDSTIKVITGKYILNKAK